MTNAAAFDLLRDPRKNKGTSFTREERDRYGLNGLLPGAIETIEIQAQRAHEQVSRLEKPINQYVYLLQLLDNNEKLFFRLLMNDPAKFMPLVYTPTVGEACQTFGHIFRRPRGIYISIKDKENIKPILQNWSEKDVRFTVVTDGERILGLGDLGDGNTHRETLPLYRLCRSTSGIYFAYNFRYRNEQ
jgi:malate dehydrogenase (oxaloacetate-decarboxylating)(NADP+)